MAENLVQFMLTSKESWNAVSNSNLRYNDIEEAMTSRRGRGAEEEEISGSKKLPLQKK